MSEIVRRLEAAILTNTKASMVFYQFLVGDSAYVNFLKVKLNDAEGKQILRLITSPRGRVWIKNNIDGFLNYLAQIEREGC